MVDRLLEADQVRLFIKNLQSTYRQHMQLTSFEDFSTLQNAGMQVEEDLARKHPRKPLTLGS